MSRVLHTQHNSVEEEPLYYETSYYETHYGQYKNKTLKISLEKEQLSIFCIVYCILCVGIKSKLTSELKKMSYLQLANYLYSEYLIF